MSTTTTVEQEIALQPLEQQSNISGVSLPQDAPLAVLSPASPREEPSVFLPRNRSYIVIVRLAMINFLSSMGTGLLGISTPRMARDLSLPTSLILWPTSVYALTFGACLLLAGSVADVVGNRIMNLVGCFLLGCLVLATGLAQDGNQLIVFRAFQGIAMALHLPTSISTVARSIASGRRRNIGLACLGLSQPLGYSTGLVLGALVFTGIGIWALPSDERSEVPILKRLRQEVDWVGASIACTSLALLSYVLAMINSSMDSIRQPSNVAILIASVLLFPAFGLWMRRREKQNKPALIPNSLWKNTAFTSICTLVLISYAVVESLELFASLFFQEVHHVSALGTSLRLLPSLVVSAILNLTTGVIVDKVSTLYLVLASSLLNAVSPLLMALIDVKGAYWHNAFFAQVLQPLSSGVLFTVGILIVSDVFPARTQGLAGAVFNTVAQFGSSLGLTIMAVITTMTTEKSAFTDKDSSDARMVGYRAGFWASFAWMLVACMIGAWGLRKIGKIGVKKD